MALTSDAGVPAAPGVLSRRQWALLAALCLGQLMVVLDSTVVNIALPAAQADVGFADDRRSWIVTAYALTFGGLLLLGGRLGDVFGARRTFLIGVAGFAVASAAGGAATTFGLLVAARAAQGAFAALLAPAALALLTTTFPEPRAQGRAFGIFAAAAAAGGAAGLVVGGVLTDWVSWRWAFYINIAIAVAAYLPGRALLPRPPGTRERARIDVAGAATVSAALFAVVFGLSRTETAAAGDPLTIASLTAGVVLLGAFGLRQARTDDPLLPPRVLLDRLRALALLAVLTCGAGTFAIFLFLTYYLQGSRGLSPVQTGFGFLPIVVASVAGSTVCTAMVPRFGARAVIAAALTVAAAGAGVLALLTSGSGYAAHVVPAMMLAGAGTGGAVAPAMQAAVARVRGRDAGAASATVNTMLQFGGSAGVALLSAVAARSSGTFCDGVAACTAADAAVHGYTTAFRWCAALFLTGALLVALWMRRSAHPRETEE